VLKYKPDLDIAQKYWDAFWHHLLVSDVQLFLIKSDCGLTKKIISGK